MLHVCLLQGNASLLVSGCYYWNTWIFCFELVF